MNDTIIKLGNSRCWHNLQDQNKTGRSTSRSNIAVCAELAVLWVLKAQPGTVLIWLEASDDYQPMRCSTQNRQMMKLTLSVNHQWLRHSTIIIAISETFRIRKRACRLAPADAAGARPLGRRRRSPLLRFRRAAAVPLPSAEVEPGAWPYRSNQLMDYRFCVSRRQPASDLIWCRSAVVQIAITDRASVDVDDATERSVAVLGPRGRPDRRRQGYIVRRATLRRRPLPPSIAFVELSFSLCSFIK